MASVARDVDAINCVLIWKSLQMPSIWRNLMLPAFKFVANTYIYIYIYIHLCVCVCVCVYLS